MIITSRPEVDSTIKILKQESDKMLIERYKNKYIRFKNGSTLGRIYDLKITDEEAYSLLNDSRTFINIINEYITNGCTSNFLVLNAMDEYLRIVVGLSEKRIKDTLTKLNQHPDIFYDFYEYILNEEFSNRPVIVEGYTAKMLAEGTYLKPLGAFNYLIYLRTDTQEALIALKKGLPRK